MKLKWFSTAFLCKLVVFVGRRIENAKFIPVHSLLASIYVYQKSIELYVMSASLAARRQEIFRQRCMFMRRDIDIMCLCRDIEDERLL